MSLHRGKRVEAVSVVSVVWQVEAARQASAATMRKSQIVN
jgi:hypothetical protein